MRKAGLGALLLVAVLYAAPASANCEECSQYWYWQCNCWCRYCVPSYCGYFQCQLTSVGVAGDWCGGGGQEGSDQCFTPGQGCVYEPSEHALKDKWRLKQFEVIRPEKPKAVLVARND